VDRGGRTGEIIDLIHLKIEREGDVVTDQLKVGIVKQVGNIALGTGVEIIAADDVAAIINQSLG
jgi:hypothetical protein